MEGIRYFRVMNKNMRKVGDGTRALNFFIDTAIIFVLAYTGYKVWSWYVIYWHYPYYKFGWFFFGILFIYYCFFEGLFSRTPGKWFTFSRVINVHQRKPSFLQVIVRSLVRITIIDMFFIPFLGKPLHDYLSKTEVVEV